MDYLIILVMIACIIFALTHNNEYSYSVASLIFLCFMVIMFRIHFGYANNGNPYWIPKYEHMTDLEAIQNVASMMKDGALKVNNIDVTGNITASNITVSNAVNTGLLNVTKDCTIGGAGKIGSDVSIAGNLDVSKRIKSEKMPVAHSGDKFNLIDNTWDHARNKYNTCGVRFVAKYNGVCNESGNEFPDFNKIDTAKVSYNMLDASLYQ